MSSPFTLDSINYDLTGCVVQFLTIDDILRPNDFIRGLVETGNDGGFDTSYEKDEWRGLRWHTVDSDFSGWVGKTYRDYLIFAQQPIYMGHEIVRVIPTDLEFELKIKGKI